MTSILPFDEINQLEDALRERFASDKKPELDELFEWFVDLFLLSYGRGVEVTNMNLASDWKPDADEVMATVDKKIAGKTWKDRVKDYYENGGNVDDFVRIVETETHRDANAGALSAAKRAGATTKTWITMMDDRVRDSHDYLLGVTVKIDDEFYTFDGSHAPAPGMFGVPEEDCNCRCELLFS